MKAPTVREILGLGWTYCPRCETNSMVTEGVGWHCPWCGVDDCAGHDDEAEVQSLTEIIAKIREVVEGVELPDTICPIDGRSCVGGEPARKAILKAMGDNVK